MSSENNVVIVHDPRHLPYIHIPFSSVEQARAALKKQAETYKNVDPDAILYVYEGRTPGWRIVAYPIVMSKPKEAQDDTGDPVVE